NHPLHRSRSCPTRARENVKAAARTTSYGVVAGRTRGVADAVPIRGVAGAPALTSPRYCRGGVCRLLAVFFPGPLRPGGSRSDHGSPERRLELRPRSSPRRLARTG